MRKHVKKRGAGCLNTFGSFFRIKEIDHVWQTKTHCRYDDTRLLCRLYIGSCVLCVAAYLWIALIPIPILGLIGCAICGFSVGILWPGTFSTAAVQIKGGGTVMFALLALAGDLGCSSGPTLAGFASSMANNNLRMGTLAAIVFPAAMLLCLLCSQKARK